MPAIDTRILHLEKRFPLRISRGEITGSDNLFVSVMADGLVGWGEAAPGPTEGAATAEEAEALMGAFAAPGFSLSPWETDARARAEGLAPCVAAALDMALWDLLAKRAGLPLTQLLGLPRRAVPSSLTIGINPPEVAAARVPLVLAQGARALKIKLGSPEGIGADKAMYEAVRAAAAGSGARLRVDANGGWSLPDARHMMAWLAEREAEYVEQPLARGEEAALPELFEGRPLPIFLDESCRTSADIPGFADRVDGVNLKLMKCGGITEALRIVATARAHGLSTMIGCMGESAIAIAAGAALSALFDHIDLDSHLNLAPDPAEGAPIVEGIVLPEERPGHGGRLRDA